MLRAVIFDFNGIIVDDEPVHFRLFQKVLGEEGLVLTEDAYYERYLGFDDKGAFSAAYRENGRPLAEKQLNELIERKATYYQQAIQDHVTLFPGVKELIMELQPRIPLAVASGALRHEILAILTGAGLLSCFTAVVASEDVERGKPEPDIFLAAVNRLNTQARADRVIRAADCLVIEDSKEGIKGARRAGMKCLAVTNSHPADLLHEAHAIVNSLEHVDYHFLAKLCS
jgi:HAD superfamily hydrolase (TIGR01509 family)